MFWYDYEYEKATEIFKNMLKIKDYSATEFIVLIFWTIIIFWFIFYIIPFFNIYLKKYELEKKRKIKKQLIDRIVVQKNLEDIISRELNEKK